MNTLAVGPRMWSIISVALLASLAASCENDPVAWQPPDLSLIVSNTTTGGAFDLDGFTVLIDGVPIHSFELNDTLWAHGVPEGRHVIGIGGLAANCSAGSDSTRTVDVRRGTPIRVNLDVVCTPPPELASTRIVFARSAKNGSALVAMNADGSGRTELFSGAYVSRPDVSPDRSGILFNMGSGEHYRDTLSVYVMNSDGSGVTRLVDGPASDPRWSPDGEEIAYVAGPGYYGGALHVMPAAGGQSTQLTGPDELRFPSWSPDGQRIAFVEFTTLYWDDYTPHVLVTDRLGTQRSVVVGGTSPVWSAVDDRIALGSPGIRAVIPGAASAELLLDRSGAVPHDWAPDGTLLLFTEGGQSWSRRREDRGLPDRTDVYLLIIDTGEVVRLTSDGAHNTTPTFW